MRCWLCGCFLDSHNASNVKHGGCKRCFPDYGEGVGVDKKDMSSPDDSTMKEGVLH